MVIWHVDITYMVDVGIFDVIYIYTPYLDKLYFFYVCIYYCKYTNCKKWNM